MDMKTLRSRQTPSDIFLEILVWLPVNTLLRFKTVCKEWYTHIISPLFIQEHLQKSLELNSQRNRGLMFTGTLHVIDDVYHLSKDVKLNWPEGTLREHKSLIKIGLCNGLVCFGFRQWIRDRTNSFLICNPSMRTFKTIPRPPSPSKFSSYLTGFGYDSEHDDYKIVVVTSISFWNERVRDVFIYSLKAGLWRHVTPSTPTSPCPSLCDSRGTLGRVVYENNMLHYITEFKGVEGNRKEYIIARFDLSSERWTDDLRIPVPQFRGLDGSVYRARELEGSTDILILEKKGSKESSWSKVLHMPGNYFKLLSITTRSESFRSIELLPCGDVLTSYDQQERIRVPIQLAKRPREVVVAEVCIMSLVSIPGCSSTKLQQDKNNTFIPERMLFGPFYDLEFP